MFSMVLMILGVVALASISKVRKALTEYSNTPEMPSRPEHESEQEQPDYFTYETLDPDMDVKPQTVRPCQRSLTEEDSLEMVDKTQFDLRQAVIYQTILQNDYIADLK